MPITKELKKALTRVLGYELRKVGKIQQSGSFELYQYNNADGSFDYNKYRQIQIEGNKKKLEKVFVNEDNIKFLSDYIKSRRSNPTFGLCHGTRRGKEQEWFMNNLPGCEVIGTEISDTATDFPHTIQWDFHEVKDEWVGAVDFIYSNSLDHSYNPEMCLSKWMTCLNKGGVCIIEHTSDDELSTELDPFGANISMMPYLILLWGKGKYSVREILSAPAKRKSQTYVQYLIIQNNEDG